MSDNNENKDMKLNVKEWGEDNMIQANNSIQNVYVNNVNLGFSNWDMFLLLGEMLGEKDGKLVVINKVRVTMSLQFAKALSELLKTNLDAFEKETGEISLIQFEKDKITETTPSPKKLKK